MNLISLSAQLQFIKYLECRLYSEKILLELCTMNTVSNKEKRRDYVQALMDKMGQSKFILLIYESNWNLFLLRTQGRSRKGTHCSVKSPTSKGKNIHIIAGISQQGLVHWERRRGNYIRDDCCEWVRRMLRSLTEPFNNIIVVCDNSLCSLCFRNSFWWWWRIFRSEQVRTVPQSIQ